MKKLIFIAILMGGVAFGQLRTVNEVIDTFVVKMNTALDQIEDFQTQINSLRIRILALEYIMSNSDSSKFTIQEIDDAITNTQNLMANSDTSKYTVTEIDSLLGLIESVIGYSGVLTTIPAVIRVTRGNPRTVKLNWNLDNTGHTSEYKILYIQGEDTTKMVTMFNFTNGTPYSEVWDWCMSSSIYNYCYIDLKTDLFPVSYIRLGVVPVGRDMVPNPVSGVRIQ